VLQEELACARSLVKNAESLPLGGSLEASSVALLCYVFIWSIEDVVLFEVTKPHPDVVPLRTTQIDTCDKYSFSFRSRGGLCVLGSLVHAEVGDCSVTPAQSMVCATKRRDWPQIGEPKWGAMDISGCKERGTPGR